MRPRDTSEEAWAIMEAGIARMTPAERVARAIDLTILAHAFALAEIRRQHPEEDERTHRLRLAATYIDGETMKKAFGWPDDRLQKLRWYREGGETSDRQWRDIVAVLRRGSGALDNGYLDTVATGGGLAELLARARNDAR